jgi:hypothetical protein
VRRTALLRGRRRPSTSIRRSSGVERGKRPALHSFDLGKRTAPA